MREEGKGGRGRRRERGGEKEREGGEAERLIVSALVIFLVYLHGTRTSLGGGRGKETDGRKMVAVFIFLPRKLNASGRYAHEHILPSLSV